MLELCKSKSYTPMGDILTNYSLYGDEFDYDSFLALLQEGCSYRPIAIVGSMYVCAKSNDRYFVQPSIDFSRADIVWDLEEDIVYINGYQNYIQFIRSYNNGSVSESKFA